MCCTLAAASAAGAATGCGIPHSMNLGGCERQAEGIKRYQARLARGGRKPGPEPHGKEREIKAMRKKRKMIREIMAATGLSKASVYRALEA